MKKLFFILNLVFIAAVLASTVWYLECGGLWRKGLTSFGFVVIGLVNLVYLISQRKKPLRFPVILVVGLVLAMLGDIVLNVDFIGGAALFAVGHIFYAVSYAMLKPVEKLDVILSLVIFAEAGTFLMTAPIFDFGGGLMKGICVGYALVISCMFGKALTNVIRERNAVNLLLAVGSGVFVFSDIMLVLYVFADAPKIVDILCVATYYPAQCFLAHAIYWQRKA